MKFIKTLSLLLIPLLLLTGIAPIVGVASASPPAAVSGSYTLTCPSIVFTYLPSGNFIVEYTCTISRTGDMVGDFVESGRIEVNGKTLKGTIHAKGTYTGTVLGSSSGTAEVTLVGVADFSAITVEESWVIDRGSGGLTGIHGQGTNGGTLGCCGTYSGQIHFDS